MMSTMIIWWECDICRIEHKPETTQECLVIAHPLMTEFFRNPFFLQQLSRIEIRRSIWTNYFERRVQTLPPPLPTYGMYGERTNCWKIAILPDSQRSFDLSSCILTINRLKPRAQTIKWTIISISNSLLFSFVHSNSIN